MTELSHMVKHFITKGEDTAILVDGLEYLILHNSFEDVLRMIQGLDDVVVQNKARLIVSVDPSAINEQQFHLLKRELTEFGPNIQ
jgi:archaellum biogenesis ATPase FlaH